ncbi:MAG: SCP2 sterol-binding domain-containing protein [Wujia sp.]
MTYADFFYEIKNKFMGTDVSDIHEHLAFQFDIEDEECGGIFYVEVKEGQLYVEPYEYFDRDAKFISSPDTFMKLAEGKLDPIAAFTMQKLKVEGNIDKALRLKEIIDMKKKQEKKVKRTKKSTKGTETENK